MEDRGERFGGPVREGEDANLVGVCWGSVWSARGDGRAFEVLFKDGKMVVENGYIDVDGNMDVIIGVAGFGCVAQARAFGATVQ